MKRIVTSLAVMVMVLGGAAAAQADEQVVAKIPFAFVVDGVQLPAGDYVVSRDTRHPELVTIALASGERKTLTLSRPATIDVRDAGTPGLEFERVGSHFHLSLVTLGPGNRRAIDTPNPRY